MCVNKKKPFKSKNVWGVHKSDSYATFLTELNLGREWRRKIGGSTTESTKVPAETCNLGRIEARLHRLESNLVRELNSIRNEIRDSTRTLDNQNRGIRTAVDSYKKEFQRVIEKPRNHENPRSQRDTNDSVQEKIDNIFNLVQISTANTRLIDWDLNRIKTNLSQILNSTNSILDTIMVKSAIDSVFNDPATPTNTKITQYPTSCASLHDRNGNAAPSGIYTVQPDGVEKPFMVFCEMGTQEGGWTTIHNRYEGSQDFNLNWQDYKIGFGNLAGEHWLGLEKIHQLTGNQLNELLVELVASDKLQTFAHYSLFSLGSEEEGYAIKVLGTYQGNAGDSLTYHAGARFSTKDTDNDYWSEGDCALTHGGGWWFKSCDKANLNARYGPGPLPDFLLYQTMYWGGFKGPQEGLSQARMLIRPLLPGNATSVPEAA